MKTRQRSTRLGTPNPENLAPVNTGVNFELGERGSEIPPQVIQPPNI
jgi:hypothetical protein